MMSTAESSSKNAAPPPDPYVNSGAIISADRRYRYLLWREWRGNYDPTRWRKLGATDGAGFELEEPLSCVFIMLNPSTADGQKDDPTIRRCLGYAKAWGFNRLEVVNLFAYRATDPKVLLSLKHDADPIGYQNQHYIERVTIGAGIVVCAWGSHGGHMDQDETVLGWIMAKETFALGRTKDGHPWHPLYALANNPPFTWNGRKS